MSINMTMLRQPIIRPNQVTLLCLSLYITTALSELNSTTPILTTGMITDLSIPGIPYAPSRKNNELKLTTPKSKPAKKSFLVGFLESSFLKNQITLPIINATVNGIEVKAIAYSGDGIKSGPLNQAKTRSIAPLPMKMIIGSIKTQIERARFLD